MNIASIDKRPIVLYHRDCSDGFGACCVAEYFFRYYSEQPIKPIYFAIDPNRIINELQYVMVLNPESRIICLDIGFTREAFELLNKSHLIL